jgi:hypothetical protein
MSPFRRREKSGLVKKLDSLLAPVIKNLEIEDGVRFAGIRKNWQLLFKRPLTYHAAPSVLSEGELVLNVDSPAWLQELKFFTGDIIKKLSPFGVRTIRLRLGKVSSNLKESISVEEGARRAAPVQFTPEEIEYIQQTVSGIYDDELRGTIRAAIEKAISSGGTKIK